MATGTMPVSTYNGHNLGSGYNDGLVALIENRPVMLVHELTGAFLRPDGFGPDSHDGEARTQVSLDKDTEGAHAHLWYITPGGYTEPDGNYLGQRVLYYLESAAGEAVNDKSGAPKRRCLTIHANAPTDNGVCVGLPDKVPSGYRGQPPQDTQLFIITVAPSGGLTFVPIRNPGTILSNMNGDSKVGQCYRPQDNPSGDITGTTMHRYQPKLPHRGWHVPAHDIFQ